MLGLVVEVALVFSRGNTCCIGSSRGGTGSGEGGSGGRNGGGGSIVVANSVRLRVKRREGDDSGNK